MDELQPVQEGLDNKFTEVPDDWKPDAATLEFIAEVVVHEITRRAQRHAVLAKGSDRHENEGAMLTLQALASGLLKIRNDIREGKWPPAQTEEESDEKSRIVLSTG